MQIIKMRFSRNIPIIPLSSLTSDSPESNVLRDPHNSARKTQSAMSIPTDLRRYIIYNIFPSIIRPIAVYRAPL